LLRPGCVSGHLQICRQARPGIPDRSARLQAPRSYLGRLERDQRGHSPGSANQGQLAYGQKDWGPHDCGGSNGYVRSNAAQRDACREWLKARGYTHIFATPVGSDFDFYRGTGTFSAAPCTGAECILPSSGRVGFKGLFDETIADGMSVVVFLTKDDSPGNREIPDSVKQDTVGPATTLSTNFKAFILHINPSVSSWILGLDRSSLRFFLYLFDYSGKGGTMWCIVYPWLWKLMIMP
jgi:hypothetical protein